VTFRYFQQSIDVNQSASDEMSKEERARKIQIYGQGIEKYIFVASKKFVSSLSLN